MVQKQSNPDKQVNDPMKDRSATAGQGQQQGSQQSGQQQQGSQQSGQQGSQQRGGQHASGGTPALDDLDQRSQGESAQQASDAFNRQNSQRDKR